MVIWMEVSEDALELPLVIASSPSELSRLVGVPNTYISSMASHARSRGGRSRFVKVEVEDEE